jgi:hypothetical protein
MKQRRSKPKRKTTGAILIRADVLDRIMARLHDAEQKLDYLIKNLRQCRAFNGLNNNHAHFNHPLREFTD